MSKLSRRKLAQFVADSADGDKVPARVMNELAAYLVDTRRTREVRDIVRTIEEELASRGIVVVDATSAHTLSEADKAHIQKLTSATTLLLREDVDPAVIGGVKISTPSQVLDATISSKLQALKRAKL